MYEYNPLDIDGLKQIGIDFETKEEAYAFAELICEELEVRIGEAISEGLTKTQLKEYDSLNNLIESQRWLEWNCPDYRRIVQRTAGEFKAELLHYRKSIDGLRDYYEMRINSMPLEELKLTPNGRSFNCLKRAGIDTIGELRLVSDLSKIKNLTAACVHEVEDKLTVFLDLQILYNGEEELFSFDDLTDDDIEYMAYDGD